MDIKRRNVEEFAGFHFFTDYPFIIDGIPCKSLESFLRAMKYDNIIVQRLVCDLSAKSAKTYATTYTWASVNTFHWRGTSYSKESREFNELLTRAFDELYKNQNFRLALKQISLEKLNLLGEELKSETILPSYKLIFQLHRLNAKL